ncbi:hypothetical protein [Flavobacterium sp. Root186]|uniref:hypothetical protein n=1 Tax=Flavobacterium sp. Root186 TaxID=1736485 RepID=UPI0006F745C6|nr:hypothetical protein [Flavobacterium sp. Root186]KRB56803.1 hypothetical protein ASD98_08945 [Flavobacterium sp. Root186]
MDYKKGNLIYILIAFVFFGCSNDNEVDTSQLAISITNFQPSYNEVKIDWELKRPNGVIIDNLLIYRTEKNGESDLYQEKLIANLPSNETSYIDNDVPYKDEVSYSVRITYRDERGKEVSYNNEMKSEPKKFIREIVKFDLVPLQVQKDPVQPNIFHILDNNGSGSLIKYNSATNTVEQTKTFQNGVYLNSKFQIIKNNEIYIAEFQGKIHKINAENYQTIESYPGISAYNLRVFWVSGNRIYYQDQDELFFYDTSTGITSRTGGSSSSDYSESIGNDNFLFLYARNSNWLSIYGFTPENCQSLDCNPTFQYPTPQVMLKDNSIDPNILAWNSSRTKFITSINGVVYNIKTLKEEKRLNEITGKHYFQYAYDANNNIYATVQGEKKIHKFNSNYELIQVIDTKLYPIYPLVTNEGLKVLGSYESFSYWSFSYNYSFSFNIKSAIETF